MGNTAEDTKPMEMNYFNILPKIIKTMNSEKESQEVIFIKTLFENIQLPNADKILRFWYQIVRKLMIQAGKQFLKTEYAVVIFGQILNSGLAVRHIRSLLKECQSYEAIHLISFLTAKIHEATGRICMEESLRDDMRELIKSYLKPIYQKPNSIEG